MRTGDRVGVLESLLEAVGYRPGGRIPSPRVRDLPTEGRDRAFDLYHSLGGLEPSVQFRPGPWDLVFDDGIIVELDEELHFNRYRRTTLEPSWTTDLPWRESYMQFTVEHEPKCLAAARWGKRWTNPSCERMFGPADQPGVFGQGGAPRWKQRALYDAIKDIAALLRPEIHLVRLTTVDLVGDTELGKALDQREVVDLGALRDLVRLRTT